MRIRLVLRVLALVSLIISLFMILPMFWCAEDGGRSGTLMNAFAGSAACGMTVSFALFTIGSGGIPVITHGRIGRSAGNTARGGEEQYGDLGIREALAIVCLSWVIATAVGALPWILTDTLHTYTDAFFETMSGFTTTGATVIGDVEAAPRALLFWRSLTHWLGGMGIIVLSLAVLPFLGVGGMELYRAEVPGPTPEKLTPRVRQTALLLWGIYLLFTVTQTGFLLLGGMDLFDSLNYAFSTVSTGGFATKNSSVAHYENPFIEWVIAFFMFLSGVNYSLHFTVLTGNLRKAYRDEEFRFYTFLILASSALITPFLIADGHSGTLGDAVRRALFQVLSLTTTTGFASCNYDLWPEVARCLLLFLMFVGGCAASTGGGLKVVRLLIMMRTVRVEMRRMLHPRAVVHTRLNGVALPQHVLSSVTAFFMLYLALVITMTVVAAGFGQGKIDFLTALSGVIASVGNVGPSFASLGPDGNYGWLPSAVKWVFSFCMLAGRLEIFALLILFLPSAWSR